MSGTPTDDSRTRKPWMRLPNGTRVRHQAEGKVGVVDGLTEIVSGTGRNPDGRTQYRVDVGESSMKLAAEDELQILVDGDGLVMILKQQEGYRRLVTDRLHGVFPADRFVTVK